MTDTRVALTADLVVLTIRDHQLCVLLVQRGTEPFAGRWALPGGFVLPDEELAARGLRELAEETGIRDGVHLEQLATYGAPGRDPRGRTVTVAWLALAPEWPSRSPAAMPPRHSGSPLTASTRPCWPSTTRRSCETEWNGPGPSSSTRPLGAAFCPPEFTVAQLRAVYEAVWGQPLDPRNFHRKVTRTPGFLHPTGHTTTADGGRPAQLFTRGDLEVLNPPISRP